MAIENTAQTASLRYGNWLSGKLAKILPSEADTPLTRELLDGHRRAQRLGYACAEAVARELREGVTEIKMAERLGEYLKDHGADGWFHRPFAWFGGHARFDDYITYDDFHPGERRLKPGESVILDVSPIVDGYVGDIGYSTSLGPCPELDRAMDFLRIMRAGLPALFSSDQPLDRIWAQVDQDIRTAGFDNCHKLYPQGTLGHRIYRLGHFGHTRWLRSGSAGWFSMRANFAFLRHGVFQEVLSPACTARKEGLWAIEPHIGWRGGGAKFEEILVIEHGRARWLDDHVPHLRAPTRP